MKTKSESALTKIEFLVVLVIIGILILLLYPATSMPREEAQCMQCRYCLTQLGIALQNYHDVYGTFPPPHTIDAEGKPLHSWRTLILPFLPTPMVRDKIEFEKIKLNEPWDSESNQQFHNAKVVDFQCPSYFSHRQYSHTIYKMVVGENTAGGASLSSMKRKPSEVVLLIEVGPKVLWMSPNDISIEELQNAIYPVELDKYTSGKGYIHLEERNIQKKPVIGIGHRQKFHVLFADGTVKTFDDWKLPVTELEKLCRIE